MLEHTADVIAGSLSPIFHTWLIAFVDYLSLINLLAAARSILIDYLIISSRQLAAVVVRLVVAEQCGPGNQALGNGRGSP